MWPLLRESWDNGTVDQSEPSLVSDVAMYPSVGFALIYPLSTCNRSDDEKGLFARRHRLGKGSVRRFVR